MIKEYMSTASDGSSLRLSPMEHLLAATESGVVTAIMTNPIWVIKTRMFTTPTPTKNAVRPGVTGTSGAVGNPSIAGTPHMLGRHDAPAHSYHGLWHGLRSTMQTEGIVGLYRGVGMAVLGVSNGAIQFMAYEQLKQWRSAMILRRQGDRRGGFSESDLDSVKLSNTDYTVISGAAKLFAIILTYPYQVIRARVQNLSTAHEYPNAWICIAKTYRNEGFHAFYRGFTTNALRILPGTCVTFVAYENVSWMLRTAAERRDVRAGAVRTN